MKSIALIGLTAALFLGFQSHRTDFSGTWRLDKNKSDHLPPSFQHVDAYTLDARQSKDTLKVSITLEGSGQHVTFPLSFYTFTGKEVYRVDSLRGTKRRSKGSWSKDGQQFTVESRVEQKLGDAEQKFTEHEVWQLAGPDLLRISLTKKTGDGKGDHSERRYFRRVQ
jgi:hypothetical protein